MPPAAQISVIIPTFDRPAEFLAKAISSALDQTLPPFEVIVVDNGVQPAQGVVESAKVRLFRIQPRAGVSIARNFGAAMAGSGLVAFLDDDDWWDPAFLEEAHKVIVQSGAACVYGRLDKFADGHIERYKAPEQKDLSLEVLLYRNPGTGGQNMLITKQALFSVGGFNRKLRVSNDRGLAVDLCLAGVSMAVAPNAAAVLRHHEGDRLRLRPSLRLRFIWEYRKQTGLLGMSRQVGRLLRLRFIRPFSKRRKTVPRRTVP